MFHSVLLFVAEKGLLLFVTRNSLILFASRLLLLFAIAMDKKAVAVVVSSLSKMPLSLGLSKTCLTTKSQLKPSLLRST